MAISFTCEGCGKQYSVADSLAGKKAQCKKCGAVLKVPVPHREPNLNDETRLGGESIGGTTMHSLHGDSVSGRSGSGRSMSGKSMSGRSMSGGSKGGGRMPAGEPSPEISAEPSDDYAYAEAYRAKMEAKMAGRASGDDGGDGPTLEALKHVGQAKEGAFDYAGGQPEPEFRHARGPAAKNYASSEAISFLLILAFLGVLAYAVVGGVAEVPLDNHGKAFAPAVVTEGGKPWGVLAAPAAVLAVAAFAVVAPLVLAGWVIACKIANVRLPDGLYVRSLGIAVVPLMLIALGRALPIGLDPQSVMLLGLLGVPAAYALMQFVHNQKPIIAGIGTGAGTVLALAGIMLVFNFTEPVNAALAKPYAVKLQKIEDRKEQEAQDKRDQDLRNKQLLVKQADTQKSDAAVAAVRKPLDAFKASLANPQQTREKLEESVTLLSKQIDQGKADFPDRDDWATMTAELAEAKTAVAKFPSASPPADVAEAEPAGPDWSTQPGRREVSAAAFDFTPPTNATLDLDTSRGLVWHANDGPATLTVESIALPTPSQQRPWIAPAFVLNDASIKAVSIAADPASPPQVEYGTLGDLPAAKVTTGNAVVYTVHQGPTWLKCTISPASKDDSGAVAMIQSVRSIHARAAGAAAQDPFPAADLVARYPNAKPADADRIAEMLKTKPDAESAIKSAMGITPDDATIEKYGPLLVASGTEKSARMLWKIAADDTPLADKARAALRTIVPKEADDLAFAVLDIKDGNGRTQVQRGIAAMANADANPQRLAFVGDALASALDRPSFVASFSGPNLEAALEKWSSPEVAKKMRSVLIDAEAAEKANDHGGATPAMPPHASQPPRRPAGDRSADVPPAAGHATPVGSVSPEQTRLAMRVLASTHNPEYASLILEQTPYDPDQVADAVIALGPPAETATIIKLKENDTTENSIVRQACVKILAEIGTARSLTPLSTIGNVTGSSDVKNGIKDAIEKIKARTAKPA